jgi:hypothetical protein
MSSLADALSVPAEFTVAGHTIKVRRLDVTTLFLAMLKGLRLTGTELDGVELQDKAQECVETGRIPVMSIQPILEAAILPVNEGLDEADVSAICSIKETKHLNDLILYALGRDAADEIEDEGDSKKSPAAEQSP